LERFQVVDAFEKPCIAQALRRLRNLPQQRQYDLADLFEGVGLQRLVIFTGALLVRWDINEIGTGWLLA
jgi:hypothetical protein